MTFCSDDALNTHIQLYFSYTDIMPTDTLYIYDGPNTSSPLIGAYNNDSDPRLYLLPVNASINNPSGCLTVHFHSDGSSEASGWKADIDCMPMCQSVVSALNLAVTNPAPDTNYIAICPGTPITFGASVSFPENDMVYHQAEATTTFTWYFGDGTTAVGQNVTHNYGESGGYIVTLIATDTKGCVSKNDIGTRVVIAGSPFTGITPHPTVCAFDTTELSCKLGNAPGDVNMNPYTASVDASLGVSDTTFLPDGTGEVYTTSVTFNCFAPNQTLHNAWDIVSLCTNMEHSYLGDLQIELICPNSQSIILKEYPGGGGTFLGTPIDDDAIDDPGTGTVYCWSPAHTYGTMVSESANYSTLPSGSYQAYQSFAGLEGCPLNGEWSIKITDNLASDNGFIFSWELSLNPILVPSSWSFTIPIAQSGWNDGSFIINETPSTIKLYPTSAGDYNYTYTVTDAVGCAWDTSTSITVLQSPNVELGENVLVCNTSNPVTLDAGNPGFNYTWNTGSNQQTINVSQTGDYYVTVSSGSCSDTDSIHVNFGGIETDILVQNASCNNYSDGAIQLTTNTISPPCSFQWSNGQQNEDITNLTAGTYIVTITDQSNCVVTESIDVLEPTSIIIVTTGDKTICIDESVTISADAFGGEGPYSYSWNNGVNTQTQVVNPTSQTIFSVTATNVNNCTSNTGSLTITILDSLHLNLYANTNTVCFGNPVTINGEPGGGKPPYIITSQYGDLVELPFELYPHLSQSLKYCLTDACTTPEVCETIDITVNPLPDFNLTANIYNGCEPLTVDLTATGEPDIIKYVWDYGDGYSNTGETVNHTFENSGNYNIMLTATDNNGCLNSTIYPDYINVYPKPEAKFITENPKVSILKPEVEFTNLSLLNYSNLWSFGDSNSSMSENPVHIYSQPGIYKAELIVTSEHNCTDITSMEIIVEDEATFWAPTAISPNHDGINDVFYVTGKNIVSEGFLMNIYNRWGELIYSATKFNPDCAWEYGWNGSVEKNKVAQIGTYTWLVKFKNKLGVLTEKTGTVTVVK